jgi:cardiolipin synthase
VPNILSAVRILMVPFIIWTYFDVNIKNHYIVTAILLTLSGLTDVVDGFIAGNFNMISDVGKILDPVADKLTQVAVAVCLATNHYNIIPLVVILFAKELFMLIGAIVMMRKVSETPYARWWGKLATVVLYATMLLVILSDNFGNFLPERAITAVAVIAIVFILFSLASYFRIFHISQKNKKQ